MTPVNADGIILKVKTIFPLTITKRIFIALKKKKKKKLLIYLSAKTGSIFEAKSMQ